MSAPACAAPRAPAGWGWRPGAELFPEPLSAADLPELSHFSHGGKSEAIKRAIASVPGLCFVVTTRDIQDRYGVGYGTAYAIKQSLCR